MRKSLSSLTSLCVHRCLCCWCRPSQQCTCVTVCWCSCRFAAVEFVCWHEKRKNKRHLYFVIRTRSLERGFTVGRAEKSVWYVFLPHPARAARWTGSDYSIVTSSMCSAQHAERGWHFSCPKGHAEWVMYQWGGIYASLLWLVANRCNSLAT